MDKKEYLLLYINKEDYILYYLCVKIQINLVII